MSLEAYFYELISRSRRRPSDAAGAYVVHLLVEFAHRPLGGEAVVGRVLAARDVLELKEAGDEALFVSGFYPEHVERLGLGVSYYGTLGSIAYRELSCRFTPAMRPVFRELGSKFGQLQGLLGDVRRACPGASVVLHGPGLRLHRAYAS